MRPQQRDPMRIQPTLDALGRVWAQMPDLRLGQLIYNACRGSEPQLEVFHIEDDELLRRLGVSSPPQLRPTHIDIDCSSVTSAADIHTIFADRLGFPGFYGHNWDAFWDVLTGFGCFPPSLTIIGRDHLDSHFPAELRQLETCFSDCLREHPDIAPAITWR